MGGDLFMIALTVEHPISQPVAKKGDDDDGGGDNDEDIDGLDLDADGDMDTDKNGSAGGAHQDKEKPDKPTPPLVQVSGATGHKTRSTFKHEMSNLTEEIMKAAQE
jgi:hypothetical protein